MKVAGYASLFWARDLGGDIVAAGAFSHSLALAPGGLPMLHGHDARRVVGRWTETQEDARGLFVRGRIDASTPAGRIAAHLVRAGALDGLSIGFVARRARSAPPGRTRVLSAIDLLEVSLVANPMLPAARLISLPPNRQGPRMKETKAVAASPEANAAHHEMMAAFEAYRAENDARLVEIERKGSADPLLEEKVARIDTALAAAQARMDRAAAEGRRPALGTAVPVTGERKSAFEGYLRTGADTGPLEVKGLSDSVSTAGGYVAPPELERLIDRRLQATSPMREIATVRQIGAAVFNKPVSTSGLVASWAAETAARTETTPPVLDLLSFPAADLYAAPAATQALLDDAAVNIDEWLASEVEDAFATQETAAFTAGDGVAKPKGFLSYTTVPDASQAWGQIGYVATGAAGAFPTSNPADKLLDLIYAPRAPFRPNGRFVMNRRTVATIRKFKDVNGDYILIPPSQPGQTATIFGYPVTEIEAMPDIAANTYAVAFGDFAKGYLIVDRAGVRVLRDPFSAKPYVLFYTLKRVGGGVQNFDAIKLLKFAAS